MGGLTSAVHWWEESQLRVLVVSSLVIQFLLFVFCILRRLAVPGWLRSIMWLAYLAGDAVAIYTLAMLFNRHKTAAGEDGRGGMLEVVWAPILLIHLGGHDGITAYNIEDNELWSRHLLAAVSQVTVAIYVFCKTWRPSDGDKRLLQAAILLFVPGVLKCFAKPWALKSASIYSLVSSRHAVKQEMYPLEEYVTQAKDFVVREQRKEGEAQGARASSSTIMQDEDRRPRRDDDKEPAGTAKSKREQARNEAYKLFVDLSSSYSGRLTILEGFCGLTEKRAYGFVRHGLATAFRRLYTKLKTTNVKNVDVTVQTIFSTLIHGSRTYLPWVAIGLFHHSHREAYNDIDVKITYVILSCTAALEVSTIMAFSFGKIRRKRWPEMVAQRSFIGYVVSSIKHNNKILMSVSRLLGFKYFLDQHHWRISPCSSSRRITGLVHQYLKDGWKQTMHDAASYRRFNDNRGHWTLEGNDLEDYLGWTIKGPFDESVLRWHIATDFCFFLSPSSSNCKSSVLCRQMSNYMAYLLLVNPEMLLPGSRRNLSISAQEELEAIFNNSGEKQPPVLDKRALAEKIVSKLQSSSSQEGSSPPPAETFIHQAWELAQALKNLGDQKMWEVIQGVWVEMLCYSAGRCRGYLHAKALGEGGEFLSYVWLLMFFMGMETFTDKLQREDIPSHEAAGTGTRTGNNATASPKTSTSEQASSTTGSTTASASEIRLAEDMMASPDTKLRLQH